LRELRALAKEHKVIAIGEIGLDYYRKITPPDNQHRVFRAQLDLAAELELPVIIHCRDAHSDAIGVIRAWQQSGGTKVHAGVFHSFSGKVSHAEAALELGFYLGITGLVTFPSADGLRKIVAQAPNDRLLIETDAPFLTPQPRRGKRNEPAYVRWVAEKVAEVRETTLDTIARTSTENANRLFGWDK
jgi:TatD DNase family protein